MEPIELMGRASLPPELQKLSEESVSLDSPEMATLNAELVFAISKAYLDKNQLDEFSNRLKDLTSDDLRKEIEDALSYPPVKTGWKERKTKDILTLTGKLITKIENTRKFRRDCELDVKMLGNAADIDRKLKSFQKNYDEHDWRSITSIGSLTSEHKIWVLAQCSNNELTQPYISHLNDSVIRIYKTYVEAERGLRALNNDEIQVQRLSWRLEAVSWARELISLMCYLCASEDIKEFLEVFAKTTSSQDFGGMDAVPVLGDLQLGFGVDTTNQSQGECNNGDQESQSA